MTKSRNILKPRAFWTEAEDAILRERYATTVTAELAATIERTLSSTHQRARKLGLEKSVVFIAEVARERTLRPDHGGRATQFKPGVPSWSKGVKGRVGVQEACRATQFKPGRAASESRNYRPIGDLRINRDGHLERKVTDDPSIYPARRWTPVYRLAWIAAYGEIPVGHLVRFKRGQSTVVLEEITADKLECVTRQEHMRSHTYHQYGPEIASVVQLRGAITRQISSRSKGTE